MPQQMEPQESVNPAVLYTSPVKLVLLHLICGLGLVSAFWVARNFCALTLIESTAETLRLVWAVEASIVILVYSILLRNPDQSSLSRGVFWRFLQVTARTVKCYSECTWSNSFGASFGIQYVMVMCIRFFIGAWLGAWPMPLDWERPWQDWPICVTYGAISGYTVGMIVSSGFAISHSQKRRVKSD